MHQTADGEVGQQQSVELLSHQIRRLAAQDDFSPTQVGLQLIECSFDIPPQMIQRREFPGWRLIWVEDGCHEPVDRLRIRNALEDVIDYAHYDTVALIPPVRSTQINSAEIGPIRQPTVHVQGRFLRPRQRRSAPVALALRHSS